ncbi:MAG: hypothetical protein ABJG14_03340 [Sulfitobacter sp.]|uniref:hypothetical protein n=1 Tax=Alphaproteobacteria TaxID=28211 RepID=UPI003265DCF6
MPAPKGSKNARAYQDALVSKNKELIEEVLAKLKEARANFESITALSLAISKPTGLTDVTLRRNKVYRALLIKYINEQGSRSGYMSRAEVELNKLRHKVAELELRLSNVSVDNDRLRAFIEKMKDTDGPAPDIPFITSKKGGAEKWEQERLRTYQLVNALVSHAYYEVNFDRNAIEDRTAIDGQEVVAGSNLAQPYVEWCKTGEPQNG